MLLKATVLFVFVVTALAGKMDYRECSMYFTVTDVEMENCEGTSCTVQLGKNTSFSFKLNTGIHTETAVTPKVSLIIGDNDSEYNIESFTPSNACSVIKCPLQQNYEQTYFGTFYIPSFPILPIRMQFQFQLLRAPEDPMACYRFDITLKD